MGNFKVGDRVRFTDACWPYWWFGPHTAHKEGVVSAVGYGGRFYDVKVKGYGSPSLAHVSDEHIEPAGIKVEAGKFYKTRDGRKAGPMENWVRSRYREKAGDGRYWSEDGKGNGDAAGADLVAEWSVTSKAPAAIVALIENGQPKPSARPHVHASRGAAEDEASRLARKHKGKTFGVYELVSERSVPAPTYKHEWQRLAAIGQKLEAVKTLRAAADIGLSPAIDAVERFLQAA